MDVVQVSLRRKLCGLVRLNHPLTINDELVSRGATVRHFDSSRKSVFCRPGERKRFRPFVKVACYNYRLGGRRRPRKTSEREKETIYSEAYHSTMNSYNSLMVSRRDLGRDGLIRVGRNNLRMEPKMAGELTQGLYDKGSRKRAAPKAGRLLVLCLNTAALSGSRK